MFTKINSADKLSNNDKINAFVYDGFFQGRSIAQLRPNLCRAVVGVNAHSRTKSKQSLFRTHIARNIVPLVSAYRTEKHTIGSKTFTQFAFRQRITVFINGASAHIYIGVVKGVSVSFSNLIKHFKCLIYDLGADTVTTDNRYIFNHYFRLLSRTLRVRRF